jgi:hypothetical protein
MRRTLLFLLPFLSMLCSGSPAAAQTRLFIPCPSGVPCQTLVYVHIDQFGTTRLPWLASVIAPAGVCFRLDTVIAHDANVRISVIAPRGTVYRGGNFVEFRTAKNGWYTVQLDTYPPGREQIATLRLELLAYSGSSCLFTTPR